MSYTPTTLENDDAAILAGKFTVTPFDHDANEPSNGAPTKGPINTTIEELPSHTPTIPATIPVTELATSPPATSPDAMTLQEAIAASSQLRPATVYKTTDRRQAVLLRIDELAASAADAKNAEVARTPTLSIPALLNRTATNFPDTVALCFKPPPPATTTTTTPTTNGGGDASATATATATTATTTEPATVAWQSVTYREYQQNVLRTAKMFLQLGLEPHHSVGVLAFNSPEWFYSSLAAVHAGGIIAGIYTTNSPEAVLHVLRSSHANIVVVDDASQMAKIRQIRGELPLLKAAIQTQGPYADYVNGTDGYYRWSELYGDDEQLAKQEGLLVERLANVRANECCSLVYTSGTVGQPKGVMLHHDALTWCSSGVGLKLPNLKLGDETIISYLPLSHIAAQAIDTLIAISFAVTVYFADRDALKGTLIKTLHEARPTRFMGVPRVFEKIHEKMMSVAAQNTGIKRTIATWAKNTTLQHWQTVIDGKPTESFQYRASRYLIMSKIKEALGLGRCATIVSGAAPMSPELKKYFMSIDLPILETFGMSESSGPHCVATVDHFNLDTIGGTLLGAATSIGPLDADGNGELLLRGRHIFMGYIDEPEKTNEALDDDGWLHTGDLGRLDADGLAYVTGRLKELIITAGGENIPPSPIEHLILKELEAALSNAFLVGDRRKYLTVLVTLRTVLDVETGEPTDELMPETKRWMKGLGVEYTKLSEVLAAGPCKKVLESIQAGITRANKNSTSNAQKVQKFALLPHDFSVPTGELTPTLKVKRSVVAKMYADVIDGLYQ